MNTLKEELALCEAKLERRHSEYYAKLEENEKLKDRIESLRLECYHLIEAIKEATEDRSALRQERDEARKQVSHLQER